MSDIVMYVIVAFFVASALVTVVSVGKPRESLSPGIAAASVFITGLLIVGVLYVGGAL